MTKRSWTILRFAVAIVIIIFLFTKINIQEMFGSLISAKLVYVIPAVLGSLLAWAINSYRLKFFSALNGLYITTFQAFEINLSTVFYGLFLPGGNLTGGIIKFYKLSKKGNQLSEAFISLALERVFATVALCLVGLFFWLISFPKDLNTYVLFMILVLIGLTGFCLLLFLDRDQKVIKWFLGIANRIYESNKLNKFVDNLSGLGKLSYGTLLFMILISLASQLVNVVVFFLLLQSIDIDISIITIAWVRSLVILVTMIPISIAGMGLREASFIVLLGTFGVNDSTAFAYSLLVFIVTRIVPGLIGGLFEAKDLILSGRTS